MPNYSFEIYTSCPTASSQIPLAVPWQGVTTNSTDYFNACSSVYGVPSGSGWQYARTGNAYAGLWAINSYGGNYREYLQVKLDSVLQIDSCYLIEFYCNSVNWTRYCINKMGAYLSVTAVSNVGPGSVLQYIPQIISHTFLNDTLNWMRVSGYYKANGGEQYITIGNFNTDATTDTAHVGGFYDGSGYLIDDVTIIKVAACDTVNSVREYSNDLKFKLYPNPNNGSMQLNYTLDKNQEAVFLIYDILGKEQAVYNLQKNSTTLSISEIGLSKGMYFYKVIVDDKIVKSDKMIIIN